MYGPGMNTITPLPVSLPALAAAALLTGCSLAPSGWHRDLTAERLPEEREAPAVQTADAAPGEGADGEPAEPLPPAPPEGAPDDFTGCNEAAVTCFVGGETVAAAMRFEPQTGRFWFLDPGSGNTFYADGELRTGNAFRLAVTAGSATQTDEVSTKAPAAETAADDAPDGAREEDTLQLAAAGPEVAVDTEAMAGDAAEALEDDGGAGGEASAAGGGS